MLSIERQMVSLHGQDARATAGFSVLGDVEQMVDTFNALRDSRFSLLPSDHGHPELLAAEADGQA